MDLASLLSKVGFVLGCLCVFAACVIGALNFVSDSQGSRGQTALIGCILGAILSFGGSAFIATQDLSLSF